MSSFLPTSDRARVIILGNDAQVAARPANPVQLSRACLAYGYAFVAPASWGDELVAGRAARFVAGTPGASLLVHCPLVSAYAGGSKGTQLPMCATVSPPVATARYLRAAFSPAPVHVTYVGACPGALSGEIDEQLFPDVLLARLAKAGCSPERQPSHFDNVLPADRRRFTSLPGGAPAPAYLAATLPEAHLREVAPETLPTVAKYCGPNERCLLDLAAAAGCHCAVDLHTMQRMEPPRAAATVVNLELVVDLAPTPRAGPAPEILTRAAPLETPRPTHREPEDVGSPSIDDAGYWVTPDRATPRAAEPAPIPRPALTPEKTSTASAREVRGSPSSAMPPRRSAIAITGSAVSLLLSPALRPPAVGPGPLVPPAVSHVRMPLRPSTVSRVPSTSNGQEVTAQFPVAKEVSPRQPGARRHVQFDDAAPHLDSTARLSRRLPCRAHGALVTRRPPDATHDSTSPEPQP